MSSSQSSLELLDLLEETDQVTDCMLGVYLKMPHGILDDIEKRLSTHRVERCKTEMFVFWIKRTPRASWEQIKVTLEKCGEQALAKQVYKRHCTTPANQQSQEDHPSPPVTMIRLNKKLVKQFTRVEREFTDVVHNLRTSLKDKQVPLHAEFQQYLEIRLEEDGELAQATTVDRCSTLISPHYCFLNTVILMDVIDKFVGEPLKQQLENYEDHLDEFTESSELSLLKEVQSHCPSGVDMPQVVFKLTGFWPSVTIKHFKRFIDQIFGAESSALTHIDVKVGCICVSWFTRKSVLSSLIALAQQRVDFMRHVGVMRLSIGNTVVVDQEGVDEEDKDMHTVLFHATNADCTEAVELLLNFGADPNCASGFNGTTPLILACGRGSTRIATMLLSAHANDNLQDDEGLTALMVTCYSALTYRITNAPYSCMPACSLINQWSLLYIPVMLLSAGANPNIQSRDDVTSLMMAAKYNYQEGVEALLSAGAYVNTQNLLGGTALHYAAYKGHSAVTQLLLTSGASASVTGYKESTPLDLVLDGGHLQDVCQLLLSSWDHPVLLQPLKSNRHSCSIHTMYNSQSYSNHTYNPTCSPLSTSFITHLNTHYPPASLCTLTPTLTSWYR